MHDPIYRRGRFPTPTPYQPAGSVLDEAPVKLVEGWGGAPEAYQISRRWDGHRAALADAVEGAMWILDLEDDWDDEGSVGYSQDTFERARLLLERLAEEFWDFYLVPLPSPQINPADVGSIDLYWPGPRSVLINIPADQSHATFCALGPDGEEVLGSVVSTTQPFLQELLRMHVRG